MTTTDKGFTVTADIDYDSALPFQVSLPGLSTEIHLYDTPVLRIGVRDLDLKRGAANMKPSLDIELLSTDYAKIGQLLKDAIFEYLDKGSFPVAIKGPLQLQARESKDSSKVVTADWMAQMTKPLAVNIPPALFAKLAGDAVSDNSTFNISAGGLDVKVGLTMDAEKITVPINVTLPKSLKLPPLKLDYDLGVGIYTDNTKFLGITLTNVDLAAPASDAVGNKLTATLVLTPENKDMAPAKAVAKLVEDVLYSSSVAQIVVKDIAVIPHKGTKVAQLVDQVLNGKAAQVASQLIVTGIEIGANRDDKIMLLSQIQIALPLKDLLASAGGLSLGGLTTTTNGTAAIVPKLIKVEAKSGAIVEIGLQADLGFSFPIDVDIGYIQAAIGLNGNAMVVLSVNGIRINPKSKDLSITVVAKFQDSDQLATDLSATIGAVLRTFAGEKNVDIPGKLTVGGLLFGVSDKDNIALLSKTTLGMDGSLNPAGIHAVVDLELPFTFTLKGLKSLNVGLRAKGNPLINVAVQGLALDNSNKLSPVIDANIASVQVAAGTMQYVYESIKAGKSFEGLSVNGVALVLNDGSTFSLLSKIAADLPASKMDDFKFLGKIYNALKGEIDTKTLLEFSIPVEIAVGSLDFDVHTERGKVGEVRRRNLVINSNDGGFVVRIRSTLWG
ncbi:hypothetical protein AMAG_18692 [Allomyces macrogynus ATCC 38327]|uniref:Uncharacterized protein n=1 Tax=Allomyces macrogynus (strain ATCC 38327) TaxID=578462 RepID=A0A0L0SEE7_ALLM3|nr:hypothetical protein AMAG_18692 [Allomyces macrogynus ATCC 38327]|eukprot:KNE60817.1 hypothetical protein AMAG_18692 [Allomyces macrogynus ATCC 38327]